MVKKYRDRSTWKAQNPERKLQILRVLDEKERGFDDILNRLNKLPRIPEEKEWNRPTLTVYLYVMVKEGWLNHEDKRKTPYFLNRKNPDVMEEIGYRKDTLEITRTKGRVNLFGLYEDQFIRQWRASLNFAFLNIIKDYAMLGKAQANKSPKEKIQQHIQTDIQDMIDVIASYGEVMVKRIKTKKKKEKMKEKRIAEAIKVLQKETVDDMALQETQFADKK